MDQTSSSYLPEPVIHKILSLLPPEDAVRASASSKSWRSAWISSPVLAFDESIVPFKRADFFDYVDRSLALWRDRCENRVTMEKFSLCADIVDDQLFSRFVELVSIPSTRNFKVIELRNCSELFWSIFHYNSLWSVLSDCKSLDFLSLRCFQLNLWNSLPKISSLRKLTLTCISIDEISLRNLLPSLPLLEDLVVEFCLGFIELNISCNNLRTMEVTFCENEAPKVAIEATNLQSFICSRTFKSAGIVSFSNCKFLKTLRLECIRFGTVGVIEEYISQLPALESLTMKNCEVPGSLNISHTNLWCLKLKHCRGLSKAEIITPKLCLFKYSGVIIHFTKLVYCSGLLDTELMVVAASFDRTEWFWFIKLRNFLENFSNCKVMSLNCYLEGFPEEFRDNDFLPDPFNALMHLDITNWELPLEDYPSFVHAMVELFPGVETLTLKFAYARIFIEFDEDRYFRLKPHYTVHAANSDDSEGIFQAVDEAIQEIIELLSWADDDSSD